MQCRGRNTPVLQLCTANPNPNPEFSEWGSNVLSDIMAFVSNRLGMNMTSVFQEVQYE